MDEVSQTPRQRINGRRALLLIGALLLALAAVISTCAYQKAATPITTNPSR